MEKKLLIKSEQHAELHEAIYDEFIGSLTSEELSAVRREESHLIYEDDGSAVAKSIHDKYHDAALTVMRKRAAESAKQAKEDYIKAGGVIHEE